MPETEHIKNLLIKSLTDAQQASVSPVPVYVGPRLGVKGAAIQVIDSFLDAVTGFVEDEAAEEVQAQYLLYADESETMFAINNTSIDYLPPAPVGDFFEAVPDLLITIIASTSSPGGLSPGKSDAVYAHDPDEEDDMGEIDVYISLPTGTNEIVNYLKSSRLELCGILSHEMQHVVQKMVCGYKLNANVDQDLMDHAFDVYEIDARIEETITLMGDEADEGNEGLFFDALNKCIDQYLKRNTTPDVISEIRDRMIQDHMLAYKSKVRELL